MKNRGRGVGVPTGIYATLSLSSSYAPRGASISCGLSRLRILPVTTGVSQSSSTFHESPFSCLCRKNERSYRPAQHRIYWTFVTAICATFFARSYVALRLPPINRTLPVPSCASSDLPALSVNRQCTLICVAPVTVVTCRFPSLPCLQPYTLLCRITRLSALAAAVSPSRYTCGNLFAFCTCSIRFSYSAS